MTTRAKCALWTTLALAAHASLWWVSETYMGVVGLPVAIALGFITGARSSHEDYGFSAALRLLNMAFWIDAGLILLIGMWVCRRPRLGKVPPRG